jgi:hypothetical protein
MQNSQSNAVLLMVRALIDDQTSTLSDAMTEPGVGKGKAALPSWRHLPSWRLLPRGSMKTTKIGYWAESQMTSSWTRFSHSDLGGMGLHE